MKIVNFSQLRSAEKVLFFQSLYWVLYFRVRLHHIAFTALLEKAQKKSEHYLLSNPVARLPAERIACFVKRAGDFVPGATCLVQVLAGKVLLAEHNYIATLKIGVKKDDPSGIISHAWLEHEGRILIGDLQDLELYVKLLERR